MLRLAVSGNPNCGKSCIFNLLTGGHQEVGNFPGVTVEYAEGIAHREDEEFKIIDLPGTYSLTAYSRDELVARDYIIKERPDVVIDVVDAGNLERNLYLTVQLFELGIPVVIALNMVDVAERHGLEIDADKLSKVFGVKVVKTIARTGEGMAELLDACVETVKTHRLPKPLGYSHELADALSPLEEALSSCKDSFKGHPLRLVCLRLLEGDEEMKKLLLGVDGNLPAKVEKALEDARLYLSTHSGEEPSTSIAEARYGIATGAARECTLISPVKRRRISERIDKVACNKFLGPVMLVGVVYLLFLFVFKLADELKWIPLFNGNWVSPSGLFALFFEKLSSIVAEHVGNAALLSLLNDGIIAGVGGVLGFVPLIFFMFLFISALEDTGYIARVAFILDRVLRVFGLQGNSILAMIVSGGLGGGGCAVPGIMSTRTLREEKDRLITILVSPMMNCGAKMPVYAALIAAFFSHSRSQMMVLLWFLSWVFALVSAFLLRKFVIKGEQTPFVMELPVYHVPTLRGVMMHTWNRTGLYIKKAGTIILAVSIVLWALMYFPRADVSDLEKGREAAKVAFVSEMEEIAPELRLEKSSDVDDLVKAVAVVRDSWDKERLRKLAAKSDDAKSIFATKIIEAEAKEDLKSASVVKPYFLLRDRTKAIDDEEAQRRLLNSFAGKIGSALEPLTSLAGFDWKLNIALIGGFAAKEVVIGTLGTAYSLGSVDPDDAQPVSEKLAEDRNWNPLKAFALMLFVMLYAPCVATLAVIKKETGSWKWTIFSTAYSTTLAFVIATLIYQIGSLF